MSHNQKNKIVGWNSLALIHPGEHLVDFLEEEELSQVELASRTGISKKSINEIVKGKSPITESTAFKLSKIFPVSPEFWMNLQNNYDAALARQQEGEKLLKETKAYLPDFKETYRELVKKGIVPDMRWTNKNLPEITKIIQKFFTVSSLAYVEEKTMSFAFRKRNQENANKHTLAAWVQLGELKAQEADVAPFNKQLLRSKLPEIKALCLVEWGKALPKLEKILAQCGVVVVYAPRLKNAPAQGATKWVRADKVMLMLHTDRQYVDRFWFNLFHELGHILLHGKKEVYVDFDKDGEKTQDEKEADMFAQKQLIPDIDAFDSYFAKTKDLKKTLIEFAQDNQVSLDIVAGQLTHKYKDDKRVYPLMSPYLKERITYTNITK